MVEIVSRLDSLITTGKDLLSRSQDLGNLKRQVSKKVGAGVDILDFALDLTGYKRTAQRLGKLFAEQNIAQMEGTLESDYESWFGSTSAFLSSVSVRKRNLTSKGNSGSLLRQLGKTKRFSRTETRVRHGLTFLEGLLHEELIPNPELREYLRFERERVCLLYTSPSPRDVEESRMPSSA